MDSNPDSDHVVQVDRAIRITIWIDCVYTELILELVLETGLMCGLGERGAWGGGKEGSKRRDGVMKRINL